MEIVRTVAAMRARVTAWRMAGQRVGFVPTMGALHPGHLSLIALAQSRVPRVVASIFVNPTQFGPTEDLAAYPRDEAGDAALLAGQGCDLLFAPDVAEMYRPGFATQVRVAGLDTMLCGAARPGHLDGVALVVTKLLIQAQADLAVFGEKDWQQLAVIRRLVRDLDIPAEILGGPTLREPDGLAMSSRNRYLSPEQRRIAGHLPATLRAAARRLADGAVPGPVLAEAQVALRAAGFDRLDYLDLRDPDTLLPAAPPAPARLFVAAWIGRTRLIDNLAVVD